MTRDNGANAETQTMEDDLVVQQDLASHLLRRAVSAAAIGDWDSYDYAMSIEQETEVKASAIKMDILLRDIVISPSAPTTCIDGRAPRSDYIVVDRPQDPPPQPYKYNG